MDAGLCAVPFQCPNGISPGLDRPVQEPLFEFNWPFQCPNGISPGLDVGYRDSWTGAELSAVSMPERHFPRSRPGRSATTPGSSMKTFQCPNGISPGLDLA